MFGKCVFEKSLESDVAGRSRFNISDPTLFKLVLNIFIMTCTCTYTTRSCDVTHGKQSTSESELLKVSQTNTAEAATLS